MYTHHTHAHTHIHTQEYYRGPVGYLSPATCVLSTVSPNCWRPWLLSFVLCGGAVLLVLTILHRGFGIITSPCLQRTILYIEFSRHVLYTSPVWLLSLLAVTVCTLICSKFLVAVLLVKTFSFLQ